METKEGEIVMRKILSLAVLTVFCIAAAGVFVMDAQAAGAATGEFKDISASFGSLTGTSLTFTWAKQTNPSALTAAINFLVSKGKAGSHWTGRQTKNQACRCCLKSRC